MKREWQVSHDGVTWIGTDNPHAQEYRWRRFRETDDWTIDTAPMPEARHSCAASECQEAEKTIRYLRESLAMSRAGNATLSECGADVARELAEARRELAAAPGVWRLMNDKLKAEVGEVKQAHAAVVAQLHEAWGERNRLQHELEHARQSIVDEQKKLLRAVAQHSECDVTCKWDQDNCPAALLTRVIALGADLERTKGERDDWRHKAREANDEAAKAKPWRLLQLAAIGLADREGEPDIDVWVECSVVDYLRAGYTGNCLKIPLDGTRAGRSCMLEPNHKLSEGQLRIKRP